MHFRNVLLLSIVFLISSCKKEQDYNCSDCVPFEKFVGRYHVTGTSSSWGGGSGSTSHVDEILEVELSRDTLIARGYKYIARDNCSLQSYCFVAGYQADYSYLTFFASDSVSFYSRAGGIGSATEKRLRGIKL